MESPRRHIERWPDTSRSSHSRAMCELLSTWSPLLPGLCGPRGEHNSTRISDLLRPAPMAYGGPAAASRRPVREVTLVYAGDAVMGHDTEWTA